MTKKQELENQGCLNKADDDEMLFVLRAQDISSPFVVLEWIKMNMNTCPEEKLRDAFECALTMKRWMNKKPAD